MLSKNLKVPIKVDVAIGRSWGQCKRIIVQDVKAQVIKTFDGREKNLLCPLSTDV